MGIGAYLWYNESYWNNIELAEQVIKCTNHFGTEEVLKQVLLNEGVLCP